MNSQQQDTNIDKKCRICASEIFDSASGISIFSDVYLEEKIRKYLYITVSSLYASLRTLYFIDFYLEICYHLFCVYV